MPNMDKELNRPFTMLEKNMWWFGFLAGIVFCLVVDIILKWLSK